MLILASVAAKCVSISTLASLVGISIGITSSTVGLQICAITAGIKMYNPISMENIKKHDEVVLLTKTKFKYHKSLNFYGFNRFIYYSWWISFSK